MLRTNPAYTIMTTDIAPRQIRTRALWYEGARECALNDEIITLQPGDVLLRTLYSGISRGTERLVFEGRVPASEAERMRGPNMAGSFPFPVKYGYCAVGVIEGGPTHLIGRHAFALHPHQQRFALPAAQITILPDSLPARRAVLAANMETALNALWDAGAGPGDSIAVVGAGVIGLLVASLAAKLPGADVTIIDIDASRASLAAALGCRFSTDGTGAEDADIVVHTSASAAGLNKAISLCGFEGTILELSWHGTGETPVALGGAFHARRLKLISSQVGHVAGNRRARWSHARRMAKALELLGDERLDALITDDIPFTDAPTRLPALFAPGAKGLTAVLTY